MKENSGFSLEVAAIAENEARLQEALAGEAEERQKEWEIKREEERQQILQGNLRGKEIAQQNRLIEFMQEARAGLASVYPSATMSEGWAYYKGEGLYPVSGPMSCILDMINVREWGYDEQFYNPSEINDKHKGFYDVILTWRKNSDPMPVGPKSEDTYHILARCDGFNGNIRIGNMLLQEGAWDVDGVLKMAIKDAIRDPQYIPIEPPISFLSGAQP